jgi:uncharacterized protein
MSASQDEVSGAIDFLKRNGNGDLRDVLTNSRVMIFSCSAYRSMCESLYEQFQSGASVILYRMGEGYARELLKGYPKEGKASAEMIKGLEGLARLAGWGNVRIRIIDERSSECIVQSSAFIFIRENTGESSCHFFAGVLAGVASGIFEKDFIAHEILCQGSGSTVCKFKIQLASDNYESSSH